MRSRTAGAIVTMSHPLVTGARATSPNGMRVRAPQIEQLVTDRIPAAFRRTRQPDRGGRAIPAPGYPASRHGPRDPYARARRARTRVGGQKTPFVGRP